ncbi:hypothetical protein PGB34_20560 [Xenophilus arseniciresistens]|uniref:3-oxoacyl-ACP synthase n=1 Tax=Xenophilus arseniciresistens TaxID=1283306 RepID=A0AAE3NBZ6_9BURK|nr:hypothetical protein [Xenophilus arseniciresistens]MDA7418773.1 hypothetical protein [Xenophilus arseniciresistens]
MNAMPLSIHKTGLVTSVGLSAPASCAAFRAKISNPSQTHFIDSRGEWIMAHAVPLEQPWRGLTKLSRMAAMAIGEVLEDVPTEQWRHIPLLLCVAEPQRPGRLRGVDDELFERVEKELDAHFSPLSAIVPHGRVSVAVALEQARRLMQAQGVPQVVVAAADSLLHGATLSHYERADRLLTPVNSNGFMPGEGAGALLLGAPVGQAGEMLCTGIGFGVERAHIDSEEPLRAEGLVQAVRQALADAGCQMQHIDYRITDVSGEQYYFKEAALALSRILRVRKEEFDIWHPAESMGESGAAVGCAIVAEACAAARKRYARGPNVLLHMANDAGQRAALCVQQSVAT